ncbi:MAG: FAD-binding protein [Oscillospiraceae bacterium]|nr:FAD-binding protein [Oscillospiraceae bacterium]
MQIIRKHTVIVGSGAAGLNAADRLWSYGQRDIAIITEGLSKGTSRNTGSDKQTYYKQSVSGGEPDSVLAMAETLYGGGAMDGDIALCEAAMSAQCFYRLAEMGVPFPQNEYGEYIGYKTDHDPLSRASSAGPLTSKFMTEKLLEQVRLKDIPIYDGYMAIKILVRGGAAKGVLCLNLNALEDQNGRFAVFYAANVIYATGGPAGLYAKSVYPESQSGASGIAFEAGVTGKNLTEWQYGIASVKFRWNLSGTYQQALPMYISTGQNGENPVEFLGAYFKTSEQLLKAVFLKGYQWPFDSRKTDNFGSSAIDLLVYDETENKKRRVFLDFRKNPSALKNDFSNVGDKCRAYLKNSGALFGTPAQRLNHMNPAALKLYKNNGIDLYAEPLEIAVCAQHNNGGLSGDIWWESNIRGFFPVGEVNGSHGIYRPGGSALNSGQVGSQRAAMKCVTRATAGDGSDIFDISEANDLICSINKIASDISGGSNVAETKTKIGETMSKHAAHIREADSIEAAMREAKEKYKNYWNDVKIGNIGELSGALKNRDLLISQYVYLGAMLDYIKQGGASRGSYLIEPEGSQKKFTDMIQEVQLLDGDLKICWRACRPIPDAPRWFENLLKKSD